MKFSTCTLVCIACERYSYCNREIAGADIVGSTLPCHRWCQCVLFLSCGVSEWLAPHNTFARQHIWLLSVLLKKKRMLHCLCNVLYIPACLVSHIGGNHSPTPTSTRQGKREFFFRISEEILNQRWVFGSLYRVYHTLVLYNCEICLICLLVNYICHSQK